MSLLNRASECVVLHAEGRNKFLRYFMLLKKAAIVDNKLSIAIGSMDVTEGRFTSTGMYTIFRRLNGGAQHLIMNFV